MYIYIYICDSKRLSIPSTIPTSPQPPSQLPVASQCPEASYALFL